MFENNIDLLSHASRMVDYCWRNVEMKVQWCYIAVKLWFRGSRAVILKYNELHLKLIFFIFKSCCGILFQPPWYLGNTSSTTTVF